MSECETRNPEMPPPLPPPLSMSATKDGTPSKTGRSGPRATTVINPAPALSRRAIALLVAAGLIGLTLGIFCGRHLTSEVAELLGDGTVLARRVKATETLVCGWLGVTILAVAIGAIGSVRLSTTGLDPEGLKNIGLMAAGLWCLRYLLVKWTSSLVWTTHLPLALTTLYAGTVLALAAMIAVLAARANLNSSKSNRASSARS